MVIYYLAPGVSAPVSPVPVPVIETPVPAPPTPAPVPVPVPGPQSPPAPDVSSTTGGSMGPPPDDEAYENFTTGNGVFPPVTGAIPLPVKNDGGNMKIALGQVILCIAALAFFF